MKESYLKASICYKCHDKIVLRQLGNVWKKPYMPTRKDKGCTHVPTIVFNNLWDVTKLSREANTQFWKDKSLSEDPRYGNNFDENYEEYKKIYNENRYKSLLIACKILGFTIAK